MKRLIIFLIRKRLGLKKGEYFRFTNQKESALYRFTNTSLMKDIGCRTDCGDVGSVESLSNVSLNWLLSDNCKIESYGRFSH